MILLFSNNSNNQIPSELLPYFPFLFIALFLLIVFFISFFGGWWSLANRFPYQPSETGAQIEKFYFCNMRLGFFARYNNAVNITIFENGFKLRPVFLFSVFHKPVFLKWEEIKATDNPLFLDLITCKQVKIEDYTINFYRSSAAAIQEYYSKYIANSKTGIKYS